MIPRLGHTLGVRELAAAARPARGSVERFERRFAELVEQRHAVAFAYGRSGLRLLLETLFPDGGEIICPAYTCVVVAHAITRAGCEPVFVDSRDNDFNMDLALVEEAVTERTRAIMPTSLFGHPVDLDMLDAVRARLPDVAVIQDCAHAFATRFRGRSVVPAGDAALFGLNVSKLITSIFGGMVTTDDDSLATRLRASRDERLAPSGLGRSLRRLCYLAAVTPAFRPSVYGLVHRLQRAGVLDRFTRYYDEDAIDMPADHLCRLTGVEARVGIAQVGRYERVVEHRRVAAASYRAALAGIEGLRLPPDAEGATWSHFVIRLEDAKRVRAHALRHGVELGEMIEYVVPAMPAYRDARFVDRGVARRFPGSVVNLPVHAGVGRAACERIAALVREAATR